MAVPALVVALVPTLLFCAVLIFAFARPVRRIGAGRRWARFEREFRAYARADEEKRSRH
jgi:peptidoglycan/LPS O-acetylase OafA/YrhL